MYLPAMHWRLATLAVPLLLSATFGPAAHAILMRPDKSDSEYQKLAERYPSSMILNAPDGEGVLIAPRWVLTAAHMGHALLAMRPLPKLTVGNKDYAIKRIYLHPQWSKGGRYDIALLQLDGAVEDVAPTPVYRGSEEKGKTVVIVGHGYQGTIIAGAVKNADWDKKKRAAEMIVTDVRKTLIAMKLLPLDRAPPLHGTGGPGDSGGPAYLEVDGKRYVAGISFGTDDTNSDGIFGNIGDIEIHTRVSVYADWIDEVIARAPAD